MKIIMTTDAIWKTKEFYIFVYMLLVNLYGFFMTVLDKYKAKKDLWRIKEKLFFIVAILGGSIGIMMGMTMFRHKTQHKIFYIGIPILYLLNVVCSVGILYFVYF